MTYLNHGSFGACPHKIMKQYFDLQTELEFEPIDFLANNIEEGLKRARKSLSIYVDCNHRDLVFFPNPSTALNMVAKSLNLRKGDEFLTTIHEYGALIKTWKYICKSSSSKYVEYEPTLPIASEKEFNEIFINLITKKTKIIFISQITSSTGLIFPITYHNPPGLIYSLFIYTSLKSVTFLPYLLP